MAVTRRGFFGVVAGAVSAAITPVWGIYDELHIHPAVRRIPSFAAGGTFIVNSATGIDKQLVAFMASPGERVSVTNSRRIGVKR